MALLKFSKSGRVQHLLHELKYKNHPEIGIASGKFVQNELIEVESSQVVLISLFRFRYISRKRKRGYNQSAKFAAGISESLSIPFSDELLVRNLKTETQTRKTKLNRWENMNGVFGLSTEGKFQRTRRILLVDDVITTGSTLEACSEILLTMPDARN